MDKDVEKTRVAVTGGEICGSYSADGTVKVYKGIPFAAPPVGELRFKPPAPVVGWDGVRDCTKWSASAIQDEQKPFWVWSKEFIIEDTGLSEDCLYLNVWTKDDGLTDKPVVVYIHGGGFLSGGASCEVYDGEAIAKKGVVYVSIHYRLGVLGFLTLPQLDAESENGVSGNYGILDQVAALKWVRENIKHFGGNPENVTIAGQSAGASSVNALVITPLAKGLFNKAVSMSFTNYGKGALLWQTKDEAQKEAAKAFGPLTPAELRSMSVDEIRERNKMGAPVIDGVVFPLDYTQSIDQGKENPCVLMTGFVTGDALLFGALRAQNAEEAAASVQACFGENYGTACELYPALGGMNAENWPAVLAELNGDALVARQLMLAQARTAAAQKDGSTTYVYYFTHTMPGPQAAEQGAFHTADVPYFLNYYSPCRADWWTPADYALGDTMSSYLASFAANGAPTATAAPNWEPTGSTTAYMELGDTCATRTLSPAKYALWTGVMK